MTNPHLQVFVPLTDTTAELGCPQFVPGSHRLGDADADATVAGTSASPLQFAPLRAGSAVMFDYRLVHRGLRNSHPTEARPLFYMVYAQLRRRFRTIAHV